MATVLGLVTACASLGQSLWLDELHTSWTAIGPWNDVSVRAALGNQMPLYFWGLWLLSETFGSSELVFRLPSLLAWVVTLVIVLVVLVQLGRVRGVMLWPLVALLALDRGQIFFASEARPYAVLALVNLLAWLAVDRVRQSLPAASRSASTISSSTDSSSTHSSSATTSSQAWSLWLAAVVGLDALAFWIQPTAILHIAAQAVCLLLQLLWQRPAGKPWLVGGGYALLLLLLLWPGRSVLLPAWQHRQQWASFASDISLSGILRAMPLGWLVLPVLVAFLLQWSLTQLRRRRADHDPDNDAYVDASVNRGWSLITSLNIDAQTCLWLIAGCLPLLIVLTLTAWRVVPLVHARYLMASVAPLLVGCALLISGIRWRRVRGLVMLAMLCVLVLGQGDVRAWTEALRQGRWPKVVRGEDWRGAASWIVEHSGSGPGSRPLEILCASMLIEGSQPQNVADPVRRDYLALPLKSLYMPSVECRIVPLLNAPSSWQPVVQTSREQRPHVPRWLIVRISARNLPARLQASRLQIDGQSIDFGGVQVVRLAESH